LSDKIALGTGIGVGLPATLAGVYVAYIEFVRRREGR
jgi:flagellar motor component MotA